MANRAYLLAVDDRSITWSRNPAREVLDDERRANLEEMKIRGPSDLWRAINGLRSAGFQLALSPDTEAALVSAPSIKVLFSDVKA